MTDKLLDRFNKNTEEMLNKLTDLGLSPDTQVELLRATLNENIRKFRKLKKGSK